MPLTFTEALRFAESRRVELPSEYYGTLQGRAKDLAFSIAGVASRDQLQGVLDSLKNVQTQGLTFAQWQEKVRGGEIGLDLPEHRLDNIFRTNMQVHYNAGHWQQQQRFKSTRPYLMYDAVNDSRTRPSHLALDNVIRHIDDAFWDSHYPPNGYRCRCSTISMTEAQARARGGVTEQPTEGWSKTDKGWDHNAASDPAAGVRHAEKPTSGGSQQLQQAMERQEQPVRSNPTSAMTREALKEFFGKVDKSVSSFVDGSIELLTEQGWHASTFSRKVFNGVRGSKTLIDGDALGLYSQSKITLYTENSRGVGTCLHELGHHIDEGLRNAGRFDVFTDLRSDYERIRTSLRTKGIDKKLDALMAERKHTAVSNLLQEADIKVPSAYSLSNSKEWVAECFRMFVEAPQTLELIAPQTYKILNTLRLEGM